MSSLIDSHAVAIAVMAAVSGTVILLTVCRQKPLSAAAAGGGTRTGCLRSCIPSERKEERRSKSRKKKRVNFAKDVVIEFERESIKIIDDLAEGDEEDNIDTEEEQQPAGQSRRNIPANRVALYHGMLQDRSRRMACSY